ncbi:MAG TPA: hypothetical protein PKJ95_00405 [Atribacterota bacterium]|nr:hypothetical protein [Atribacterota bacterium]
MIIPNQIVKIETIETKITPKFPEIKPEISFPEDNVSIKIIDNVIKPAITQSAISIKISEEPVKIEIPEGVKGDKGDKGDTGESGSLSSYTYTAGEILGGHRVIIIDNNLAYYADNTNLSHVNKPIGISNNASDEGGEVTIVFYGEMEESSWNWDVDKPIWISTNGLLIQTPPETGFSCIIAFPIAQTKIFIEKQEILIIN